MGCQKAITQEIIKSLAAGFAKQAHSHYLEPAGPSSHGRIEQREHWLMGVPEHLKRATKAWAGLQTIAMVRRQRQTGGGLSSEDSYYLSSLPLSTGAEVLAKAVRSHWAVENELRRMALTQLKQETTKKLGIQVKRRAGWDQTYMETVLRGAVLILMR